MKKFSYEIDLIPPVITFFHKQGCLIYREIQIGFCRADIVAFTPEKHVISIELKLADWKKAIIQAKNYQLGSDFVYVAFPLSKTFLVMKKAANIFEREGIGLLSINEQTNKVCSLIKAKQSQKKLGTISLKEIYKKKEVIRKRIPRML